MNVCQAPEFPHRALTSILLRRFSKPKGNSQTQVWIIKRGYIINNVTERRYLRVNCFGRF